MRYLVPFFVLIFALPAAADEIDAAVAMLTPILQMLGVPGLVGTGILALIAGVRASAATVSKHTPDKRLGKAAKTINWLGGNTKHAASLALVGVALILVGCSTTQRAKFEDNSAATCAEVRKVQALVEIGSMAIPNDEARYGTGLSYRATLFFCDERDRFIEEVGGVERDEDTDADEDGYGDVAEPPLT